MVEIVKNLGEIKKQPSQTEIGKIVSDVKSIIEGIKELRGLKEEEREERQETQIKQIQKLPYATLKIDEEKINNLFDEEIISLLKGEEINKETKLKDIIEKWDLIKEIIKPKFKEVLKKVTKAEIEYR